MRDQAVSITKAIGIILMVLAQATWTHPKSPIGMFHMPLFCKRLSLNTLLYYLNN